MKELFRLYQLLFLGQAMFMVGVTCACICGSLNVFAPDRGLEFFAWLTGVLAVVILISLMFIKRDALAAEKRILRGSLSPDAVDRGLH